MTLEEAANKVLDLIEFMQDYQTNSVVKDLGAALEDELGRFLAEQEDRE